MSNQLPKPPSILIKSNIVFIVTCIVILGSILASWIIVSYLQPSEFNLGFPFTDQFQVNSVVFIGSPPYTAINISIQNTGPSSWTIGTPAEVNSFTNFTVAATGTANTLTAAPTKTIYVKLTPPTSPANILTSGNQYSITLLLTDGNEITYGAFAP